MLGAGGVGGRLDGSECLGPVAVGVLVGEEDLAGATVGSGRGVRQPLDVSLLVVALVEEHACSLISIGFPHIPVRANLPLQTPMGSLRIATVLTLA